MITVEVNGHHSIGSLLHDLNFSVIIVVSKFIINMKHEIIKYHVPL